MRVSVLTLFPALNSAVSCRPHAKQIKKAFMKETYAEIGVFQCESHDSAGISTRSVRQIAELVGTATTRKTGMPRSRPIPYIT